MFCIFFSHSYLSWGVGGLIVRGFAGAEMCELYELAGWEGGADELSGVGVLLIPFWGGGDCIVYVLDWDSLFCKSAGSISRKDIDNRVEY